MGDDRIRSRDILMDLRAVDPPTDIPAEQRVSRWMWARTSEPLPDDRVLHAAAIVYLSDMSSGFVDLDVPGLPRGGSSLDHTVYFHRPARADDWMFMALEPVSAAGARGVYRGSVHDRAGTSARDARAGEPDASLARRRLTGSRVSGCRCSRRDRRARPRARRCGSSPGRRCSRCRRSRRASSTTGTWRMRRSVIVVISSSTGVSRRQVTTSVVMMLPTVPVEELRTVGVQMPHDVALRDDAGDPGARRHDHRTDAVLGERAEQLADGCTGGHGHDRVTLRTEQGHDQHRVLLLRLTSRVSAGQ